MAAEIPKAGFDITPEIVKEAEWKILGYVHWGAEEWAHIEGLQRFLHPSRPWTLSQALNYKLVNSPLGCYLRALNRSQSTSEETLLAKLELSEAVADEWEPHARPPDLVYDGHLDAIKGRTQRLLEEVVDAAVTEGKPITKEMVLGLMNMIRLAHCHITHMDNCVKGLKGLEALILSGNCLTDFCGHLLPSGLRLLELYANFLRTPSRLAATIPTGVLYLGLGRNYFNDDSWRNGSLWTRLQNLRHLGLADNDIEDVEGLLAQMATLRHLRSLQLQGNPCSVMASYKTIVQRCLPSLTTLDGTQVGDAQVAVKEDTTATLQVYAFRIMGVPKPKKVKGKNVIEGYQLEAECPLLDSQLKDYEIQLIVDRLSPAQPPPEEPPKKKKKKEEDKKLAEKEKKTPKDKKESAIRKKEEDEVAEAKAEYAEFLAKDEEIPGAGGFTSDRIQWAQVMTFRAPAIQVEVPRERARLLRDTLRSLMTLRLVYMATIPLEKNKKVKEKNEKESKKSGKEDEKKKQNKPEEIVIKREVLAKIPVPLQVVKWSDSYLGYAWDIQKPYFALPFPRIKDVEYTGDEKNRGKVKSKKKKEKETEEEGPYPIPKILTCHIGIGLKRDTQEHKKSDKKKTKAK